MDVLKKQVGSVLKLNGYSLKVDASRYLCEILDPFDQQRRSEWLDRIVTSLQKLPLESAVIDRDTLEAAVRDCSKQADNESDELFNVIDLFSAPKYEYDSDRKKFVECPNALSLHGTAESKANVFRHRIALLLQRTLRNPLFSNCETRFKLRSVEALLGSATKLSDVLVLGMLTQLRAGSFFLEDMTGVVELDMTETTFHSGLFTEGGIVLVEGRYENNVLTAAGIGLPPVESAADSRAHLGDANYFGGPSPVAFSASKKLRKLEAENPDATLVFLSDVWLDSEAVLSALHHLFTGFAANPPICFVLAGNFCSKPHGDEHDRLLKEGFRRLTQLFLEHPDLVNRSRFVFMPGLQDPALTNILPRPPLPQSLISAMTEKIPNCMFASNPCRIQYGTQEIVILREDIVEKMCRNCIRMPSAQKEIPEHFAKTIQSQGHLTPLPIHMAPIYWDYDHCLRLYPLPDLIVVCDKYEPFTVTHSESIVTNPGSFARGNFSFQVYLPMSRQVEDSAVRIE
uniref:DNA polymerase epsilon subunit n=1 Tax=Plectus sambesii TaxID=2011161 RepID=A0A914W0T5_9BILA